VHYPLPFGPRLGRGAPWLCNRAHLPLEDIWGAARNGAGTICITRLGSKATRQFRTRKIFGVFCFERGWSPAADLCPGRLARAAPTRPGGKLGRSRPAPLQTGNGAGTSHGASAFRGPPEVRELQPDAGSFEVIRRKEVGLSTAESLYLRPENSFFSSGGGCWIRVSTGAPGARGNWGPRSRILHRGLPPNQPHFSIREISREFLPGLERPVRS